MKFLHHLGFFQSLSNKIVWQHISSTNLSLGIGSTYTPPMCRLCLGVYLSLVSLCLGVVHMYFSSYLACVYEGTGSSCRWWATHNPGGLSCAVVWGYYWRVTQGLVMWGCDTKYDQRVVLDCHWYRLWNSTFLQMLRTLFLQSTVNVGYSNG